MHRCHYWVFLFVLFCVLFFLGGGGGGGRGGHFHRLDYQKRARTRLRHAMVLTHATRRGRADTHTHTQVAVTRSHPTPPLGPDHEKTDRPGPRLAIGVAFPVVSGGDYSPSPRFRPLAQGGGRGQMDGFGTHLRPGRIKLNYDRNATPYPATASPGRNDRWRYIYLTRVWLADCVISVVSSEKLQTSR